ncbi:glycosyltransferase family 32 protein [Parabacteroides goldsteinii]|jgi:hypothetical protein|uniref:glycosyltransferase family 32 protein n=1 Tax=Parabacteroides goldsteinii TaxID=328812 RepID=UPI00101B79E3|nr:glycosyltransferase [Parabacteroides goldsteinii]MBS6577253.1 glycosyl transferase [Parabacteroides goldsteinii]
MIPKVIHYCWLSDDIYPPKIRLCIDSWKKFLPDYEIILWDIQKFPVNSVRWVEEAYKNGKYAFAADYIRLYALYHYGGIYLDSDVEVIKSFDDLLALPYFIGVDSQNKIEAAVIGVEPLNPWISFCLDYYKDRPFVLEGGRLDMKTLPIIMQEIIEKQRKIEIVKKNFLEDNKDSSIVRFFPFDFFCSKRHDTGIIQKTDRTYAIHHFAMSWCTPKDRFLTYCKRFSVKILGNKGTSFLITLLGLYRLKKKV